MAHRHPWARCWASQSWTASTVISSSRRVSIARTAASAAWIVVMHGIPYATASAFRLSHLSLR
ncbi:MAG: hypothetical protein ABSG86_08015 [Thermoguttaceae bacterium]